MRDMFDCLESTFKEGDKVFLVRLIKNKKKRKLKLLYYSYIDRQEIDWSFKLSMAQQLIPGSTDYERVKQYVRNNRLKCMICLMSDFEFDEKIRKEREKIILKPTKKEETWWDRIKVWFSRKFKKNRKV
jgi:hypothetical protein